MSHLTEDLYYLNNVTYADMSPEHRRLWRFLSEWRGHVEDVRPVVNEVGSFLEMLHRYGLTVTDASSLRRRISATIGQSVALHMCPDMCEDCETCAGSTDLRMGLILAAGIAENGVLDE